MTPDSISPERIMQFPWGFAPPLAIEVAIRNRVFDFLDTTPHTVQEVAEYAKGSTRGWRAVLNCLVGLDLLAKEFPLQDDAGEFYVFGYDEAKLHGRLL